MFLLEVFWHTLLKIIIFSQSIKPCRQQIGCGNTQNNFLDYFFTPSIFQFFQCFNLKHRIPLAPWLILLSPFCALFINHLDPSTSIIPFLIMLINIISFCGYYNIYIYQGISLVIQNIMLTTFKV